MKDGYFSVKIFYTI